VAQARSDEGQPQKRDAARRRLCIATRTAQPVAAMLRFVAVGGGVVPDLERKLPGRGVWVTARRALVEEAARRGAFARGLKAKVKPPAGLPGMIDELLERSVLDALFRAGKAGLLVREPGARMAGGGRRVVALLRPRDGAADHGLEASAGRVRGDRVEIIEAFTTAQLGLALGCPYVVNAALLTGRASEIFLERWRILESFRADEPDEPRVRPHETALEPGS
jgi:predicted RNA-binding protein YlxR (DUF448 family)